MNTSTKILIAAVCVLGISWMMSVRQLVKTSSELTDERSKYSMLEKEFAEYKRTASRQYANKTVHVQKPDGTKITIRNETGSSTETTSGRSSTTRSTASETRKTTKKTVTAGRGLVLGLSVPLRQDATFSVPSPTDTLVMVGVPLMGLPVYATAGVQINLSTIQVGVMVEVP